MHYKMLITRFHKVTKRKLMFISIDYSNLIKNDIFEHKVKQYYGICGPLKV